MTRTQSFFALLRYQAFVSPTLWIFPAVIAFQLLLVNPSRFTNDLSLLTVMFSASIWMPLLITSMLFGGDLMNKNRWATHQTHVMANLLNPEFLVTRAVDRSTIFLSRSVVYWMMILAPLLIWVSVATFKPGLKLNITRPPETAQATADHYLAQIPGSYIAKNDPKSATITIQASHGTFYIKAAGACILFTASLAWQLFTISIMQFRHAKAIFWTVFILAIAMPVSLNIFSPRTPLMETLFFQVLHHPIFAAATIASLLLLVCTIGLKKFQQQEYA